MDVSRIGGHNLYSATGKITEKTPKTFDSDTTLQANQNRNESGIEINISREGRERQSSEHSKLTVDNSIIDGRNISELKAAIKGESSWESFVEFTNPSLEVPRGKGILILQDDSPQERYRKELLNATSLYDSADAELDSAGKFSSVASKYMELRKGIEEKYSSDELAEQLRLLDESYDNAVNTIADHTAFGIKSAAKIYEMKARVNNDLVKHGQTHGHTFGIPVKDVVEYDKDAFHKVIDTLNKNVVGSIKQYGALAKQYMLDGNAIPVTEADKRNFIDYLTQNTDSSKNIYSPDDLDTLNTIFAPNYADKKDTLYSALEKLQDSGLSNDIKAAIARISTQGDRMFSIIPKGYEEREQALYESMLKWQKAE